MALLLPAGYLLAGLRPTEYILNHGSEWQVRLIDLLFSYMICICLAGFLYGMCALRKLRREIRRRSSAASDAIELSLHDPLTGFPNRRKLHDGFDSLTASGNHGRRRGIMMLDLDGFKPINDVYGHAFGDTLLRDFAKRLAEVIGPDGLVARLGGDEFAVITPEIDEKTEAASIARQILLRMQDPFILDARQVELGTGVGIAIFPDDGYSSSELLRRADIALYRAKTIGRSHFRFFEMEMDAAILHRTLMEQRLRAALKTDDVKVHFQPILNLESGEIIGFEALARWTDRDFGQVPPDQFIPIAEEAGLISDLTDHLLTQACRAAAAWPEKLFLSFNISQVQLHDHAFPARVSSILKDQHVSPEKLLLEVTETALLKNARTAKTILEQLAQIGIKIALDDFGTGHSSFSYLKDYPINKVKIDKSFTLKMGDDTQCAAIVEAILVLAKGLGIDAVAEGIEQPEIRAKLSASGCQYGQGFLFGAAIPSSQIPQLLLSTAAKRTGSAAGGPVDALPETAMLQVSAAPSR